MGRASTKKDKSVFQLAREKAGLTREAASGLFEAAGWQGISPERIERIESGRVENPEPYDVLAMSEIYRDPALCNYYCTQRCKIGERYAREISAEEVPQIVLELIASINRFSERRDRLVEIFSNGRVDEDQVEDFACIQKELERISASVDSLRYQTEKMLADGAIDEKQYREAKRKIKE
ncbi:MAG: XRE family transcriptional regulator [Clostridia bacterium]|nr:XRE family transcriptional regulator [Clostridia bacterium]